MGNPGNQSVGLLTRLWQRKAGRVAVVYGIVAIAVVLLAEALVPLLDLPDAFRRVLIAVLLLAYPLAIVLAWSAERDAPATGDTPATTPAGPLPRSLQVGIALVIALLFAGWLALRPGNGIPPERPALAYIDSVAVMPLTNLTGDEFYDHVGIGITEEIIRHLARIPPLKVISRHSVQALAGRNLTVPQLASALGVRHVIEGSVQLEDGRLRIALRHINAETDAHIWAESFRGESADATALQEDIARQVSSRIVLMIPGVSAPSSTGGIDFGPGKKAYLEGERWLGQRTAEGIRRAIDSFSESIELDPGFAPAYADLSSAYALALFYRYDVGIDGYEMAARSLAMAETALELDPQLAAGYAARGYLGALIGQPAAAVAADFDSAAALQPNAASIPSWRARSLAQQGEIEQAVAEAGRAIDLDPLAPGRHIALAELSLSIGRYEDAIAAAKLATTLEPGQIRSRAIEARALLLSGRPDQCAGMSLGPHRVLRATCLDAMGNGVEGRQVVEQILASLRSGSLTEPADGYSLVIVYEDLAVDYAWRGDAIKALEWAAFAYGKSPVGVEVRVLESALFDKVRAEPAFAQTIQEIRSGIYTRVRRDAAQYRQTN